MYKTPLYKSYHATNAQGKKVYKFVGVTGTKGVVLEDSRGNRTYRTREDFDDLRKQGQIIQEFEEIR